MPADDVPSAPLVSVIATVYNQENYIGGAIGSLRAQTNPAWECVIVDDGSKDGSHAQAVALTRDDPRFKVVTKPNGGLSSARNAGMAHLHPGSRYLVFLDGDDLLAPAFIERLSGYLDAHPQAGLVTCGFVELDENAKPVKQGHRSRYAPGAFGFPRQLGPGESVTPFVAFFCATGQGPFTMIRRGVYEQTPGYDEGLCPHEDTDMFCHLALRAEAHHIPDPLYLKRVLATSIMNSKAGDAEKRYAYFRADAYSRFRRKWDRYPARDARQQALIDRARKYYYTRHRPLRDFKVALKTLRQLLRQPSLSRIGWFLHLCKSGLRGLFMGGKDV